MAKRKFWELVSGGSTIWGFLPSAWQSAIVSAVSAMTAYLGFEYGGLLFAMLSGGAMFAFGMAGAYYTILLNRQTSIFERFGVDQIAVIQASIVGNKEKQEFFIHGLTLEVHFMNYSERSIWMQVRRAHHSIGGQTTDSEPSKLISIIPARGVQKLNLATLPDIKVIDPINGSIDLEILYGPAQDELKFLFYYVCKPAVGMLLDTQVGAGQLTITFPITKHEHQRL
jgi:hypothetical protein